MNPERHFVFDNNRLVAVRGFGDKKALFPPGFVKFFAEYTRFRLQNLPYQSKKGYFFSLKASHRNKSNVLVSAFLFRDSTPRRAFDLAISIGRIIRSDQTLDEMWGGSGATKI